MLYLPHLSPWWYQEYVYKFVSSSQIHHPAGITSCNIILSNNNGLPSSHDRLDTSNLLKDPRPRPRCIHKQRTRPFLLRSLSYRMFPSLLIRTIMGKGNTMQCISISSWHLLVSNDNQCIANPWAAALGRRPSQGTHSSPISPALFGRLSKNLSPIETDSWCGSRSMNQPRNPVCRRKVLAIMIGLGVLKINSSLQL